MTDQGGDQAKRDRLIMWGAGVGVVVVIVVAVGLWVLVSALTGALWDGTEGGSGTTAGWSRAAPGGEADVKGVPTWNGSGGRRPAPEGNRPESSHF